MSDKAEEKEIWKIYPDYNFIEVSNLGRIRTRDRWVSNGKGKRLVKGRILKQHLRKKSYMQVSFRVNGRAVCLRVHRMVAVTFIPNPNGYPEVNHIDNNPTNNSVSNLEWCTNKYNIAYREKYGTPAKEFTKYLRRQVFAVNLETGRIMRFESQHEAARQLGLSQGDICSVLKGPYNQTCGYWFTEDESEITEERIQEIRAKMYFRDGVIAVNLDTFEVLYFESQREAGRKLGVSYQNINKVIKGRRDKACGYWFCYVNEDVAEKVRKRFGDNVAHKIEELINQN